MSTQVRRYNIEVRGRVQDVGFRGFVENLGKALGLHGSVYNDIDGTVKIVCRGLEDAVDEFLDLMKAKASNVGAVVEDVLKEEIPDKGFIPPSFYIVPADQLSDISRKLDAGINELRGINNRLDAIDGKLGKLDAIDGKLGKLDAIDGKLGKLDAIDGKLDGMDKKLDKLDGIDSKLGGMDKKLDKLDGIDSKLGGMDKKLDKLGALDDIKQLLQKIAQKL